MFVPSSVIFDEGTLYLEKCDVIQYTGENMPYANMYKRRFSGNEKYEGWDIYTEMNPLTFIDKIEKHYYAQEELLT